MHIRPATSKDASSLKDLLLQLGYDQDVDKIIQGIESYGEENYALLVSQDDRTITGFIALHWFLQFHTHQYIGRIVAFCVDEKWRSKGVGTSLLDSAEQFFRSKGCTRLEVTSNGRRIETHQYYLNRGYTGDSKRFVKNLEV